MRKILRFTVRRMMVAIAIVALSLAFWVTLSELSSIVESLRSPVEVSGWNPSGLILRDGRIISLPGIHNLPARSKALTHATRRGVEIDPSGRVIGLVRIHHWCSLDELKNKNHIACVDIADMMMFLREGEYSLDPALKDQDANWCEGRLSAAGWEASEYYGFRIFHDLLEAKRRAQ